MALMNSVKHGRLAFHLAVVLAGVTGCLWMSTWTTAAASTPNERGSGDITLGIASDHGNQKDRRAHENIRKLEFLIGEWRLVTMFDYQGQKFESRGRMIGRYSLGGFGVELLEVHPALADPGSDVFVGSSSFTAHRATGEIIGVSINTIGNRKNMRVEFDQDAMVVYSSGEMFDGSDSINRFTYSNVTGNSYETFAEVSEDGGETWRDGGYRVRASRILPE